MGGRRRLAVWRCDRMVNVAACKADSCGFNSHQCLVNSDMNGNFFGGGGVEYAVVDGDIYLKAETLSIIFENVALFGWKRYAEGATGYEYVAPVMGMMSGQLAELRSELLRQEAQYLFDME